MARAVAGLDEGPPDIVRANDPQFEGDPALLGIADRRGHAAVRHRDHQVGFGRGLLGQLHPDPLAHVIDRLTAHHRIRAAEIDMFENAGASGGIAERAVARHAAILAHFDDLARFDLADEFGPDHIERDRFAGKDRGIAHLAHHQRTDPQRIAAGDHPFGGHADQRIGALDHPQRIDEAIEQLVIAAGCDQVDDHFGIGGRLEDRAAFHQLALQGHRVRDVAVVRDREGAAGKVGMKRLDVAQPLAAGGRIAHVAARHLARQFGQTAGVGKNLGDMAQPAAGEELLPVIADDADCLLPAVLQGVKPQRGGCRGFLRADHAENAAFLAQFVAICVKERVCKVHWKNRLALGCALWQRLWRGMRAKARAPDRQSPPARRFPACLVGQRSVSRMV